LQYASKRGFVDKNSYENQQERAAVWHFMQETGTVDIR